MEDQKPYETRAKNTFLNDIGHTHTCQCLECQELQEKPHRDCDNCSRPVQDQVCPMSAKDTHACLEGESRPFWKPKQDRNCFTCGKRINNKVLECPLEHDALQECVRDFWSMWEPIKSFMGSPDWAKKQELKADQAVEFVRGAWTVEKGITNTQWLIRDECQKIMDKLLEKNRKYGDSAIKPVRVFSKADPAEQINVRLDDKISRIMSGQADEDEDVEFDLIGYLILKRVQRRIAE